ncbi:RNA ligase 2 [Bacteriophage DSS3_VP1]|uniref:RNA ligase 2 n=1 Tax=Bacteriophage DSS3_VP1 TaxID=2664196 RepID=A0A7S5FQD8_9CAUD|nr:RNA ligase 2 [Bacteriophage DSS3_VP1]QGH74664.1 RNA ligase 2 [Bacteriophage DSS3_VP1]
MTTITNEFRKFTSINKFSDAMHQMYRQDVDTLRYRQKIKLHGTNAAVRVIGNDVSFQKRRSDVSIGADNAGFAFWASHIDWITSTSSEDEAYIIDGEWAGPGVQKSDAVTLTDKKRFYVFGVRELESGITVYDPDLIRNYVPEHEDIVILPYHGGYFDVFNDNHESKKFYAESMNRMVDQIGECDPFIKEMFGVEGAGEGLVGFPITDEGFIPTDTYNTFVFKAKSEAHRVQKTKVAAKVAVDIPDCAFEFVDSFVTENRMNQMVEEFCGGEFTSQNIGPFLKALSQDVMKESTNELAAAGLEWKQVNKLINKKGVDWFKAKQETV